MIRILLLLLTLFVANPAMAHGLKVFASAGPGEVTGYAFFIGGGRAMGAGWVATDAAGAEIGTGKTDDQGAFRVTVPDGVSAVTVTVDTGDGHAGLATVQALTPTAPASGDIGLIVEAAVAKQVAPLEAKLTEMEAHMRFTDILSGIFLILGLAGMALWATGRRKTGPRG